MNVKGWAIAVFTILMTWSVSVTAVEAYDPLEPINRPIFYFNRKLDDYVLKPAAEFYEKNMPKYFQTGFKNLFSNVKDAWSAVNLVLQGKVGDGLGEFMRFGINSTFGLFGWIDWATPMGLRTHKQDLGQTLGHWGVGPGPYIVWPVWGSSTLRDSLDIPPLMLAAPETFVRDSALRNILTAVDIIQQRASLLDASDLLDEISIDPYIFMRDGYLQYRQNLIEDEEDDEDSDKASKDAEELADLTQPEKDEGDDASADDSEQTHTEDPNPDTTSVSQQTSPDSVGSTSTLNKSKSADSKSLPFTTTPINKRSSASRSEFEPLTPEKSEPDVPIEEPAPQQRSSLSIELVDQVDGLYGFN